MAPGAEDGHVFALYDLDGFKVYNDSYGHPAGDSLLRRLGANLAATAEPDGCAYRLGGDEFCILARRRGRRTGPIVEAGRAALTERGEGFRVSASAGAVLLADEVTAASEALRLADRRMYAEKSVRSGGLERRTHELLVSIQRDREPELTEQHENVSRLAVALGRELGLDAEEVDVLRRAAELHDIGSIAIPDEILRKPGPLDDIEWELMRKHTLVGERIIGATPSLAPVARLVRSSHERWDGYGYPDRLAGQEIPVGARIILICDAFDAMRRERPYATPLDRQGALAEIRNKAGTQFDPQLAELFCGIVERAHDDSGEHDDDRPAQRAATNGSATNGLRGRSERKRRARALSATLAPGSNPGGSFTAPMGAGRRTAALGAALVALALPCAALAAFPGADPTESPRVNTPNDPDFDRCEADDPDTPPADCDSYFEEQFGSFGFRPDSAQEAPGVETAVRQLRAARPAGPRRQRGRRRPRSARRSRGSAPTPPGSTPPGPPPCRSRSWTPGFAGRTPSW